MSSDVLRTSKLPNVSFKYIKLVYINFNVVHPWNAFWLTFGSSVPNYWIHSRLEQFKNAYLYIFEICDKIMIDFNLEHPSNKLDEISFNFDGNLIDTKLIQFENDCSPIFLKFDGSWNDTDSKFKHFWNAPLSIVLIEEGIEIDFNNLHI